jgi:hypothetical protein
MREVKREWEAKYRVLFGRRQVHLHEGDVGDLVQRLGHAQPVVGHDVVVVEEANVLTQLSAQALHALVARLLHVVALHVRVRLGHALSARSIQQTTVKATTTLAGRGARG